MDYPKEVVIGSTDYHTVMRAVAEQSLKRLGGYIPKVCDEPLPKTLDAISIERWLAAPREHPYQHYNLVIHLFVQQYGMWNADLGRRLYENETAYEWVKYRAHEGMK